MDIESWRSSSRTIEKSQRYYVHFDYPTDISKCWDYISDPLNIVKHSFYPFIHYKKKMRKFSKIKGRKNKIREICYAAHIDRCIFQYYNFLLNTSYNEKCQQLNIDDAAIAYRTNMPAMTNIQFAKRAFDFIRNSDHCFIMIGDYTKFFDNLDHLYLKKQWCFLLETPRLSADHYAVFKNITRYSYVERADILTIYGLENTAKGQRELNRKRRIFAPGELKQHKKLIKKSLAFGIPQGSPMSGVLANIYMLEVDKTLYDLAASFDDLYMRYSDDFIFILPQVPENIALEKLKEVKSLFDNTRFPGLILEADKTQYYHFSGETINNIGKKVFDDSDCSNRYLNFLGFTFNGKMISIRDKTVSKFYYRVRRKAKTIAQSGGRTKKGKQISSRNLYMKYSIRGAYSENGNFLSYVHRAEDEFKNEAVGLINQRHMRQIRKFLKRDYPKKKKGR
ncbi:MAG: reverse transcriptase domain-containing protein [Oscillospiraceae bacterium]|nr:reverse transcriptase domain-containing protein [Oscillospiraceae bacterium]